MVYQIHFIQFPLCVHGTALTQDNEYHIIINSLISEAEQQEAIRHELSHLKHNDLYSIEDLETIESRAKAEARV